MDEQFVKRFCDSYGIAHSVKKFDTLKYARENGLSVEMAARELRYTWFREMKEKKKMDYIVVAHHADDVAETVLINLCRGTGIKGLTGIKSINGDILRPLLPCSRTDILKYIEDHQLGFGPIPPIIHWIMCVIKYATRSSRSSKKSILRFWIP